MAKKANILKDGHKTTITIQGISYGALRFEIKRIKPPGMDGRGPIDTTTMDNDAVATFEAKKLYRITDCTLVVAYADNTIGQVGGSFINKNGAFVVAFPTGVTQSYRGYVNSFEPNEHVEGEQPTANMTLVSTSSTSVPGQQTAGQEVTYLFV